MLNVSVFGLVLIIFSAILYLVVREGFLSDMRKDLVLMADGVVSSIDYESTTDEEPLPDLIVSELPSSASESLMDLRLQWFNQTGKLAIEKGNLALTMPLNTEGGFEFQEKPKALLYTKVVRINDSLLGYARVAEPLAEFEQMMSRLRDGLLVGILLASVVSGIGIKVLIARSMQPVYEIIRTLKQFTADASHELRTPVTAISTNSSVALKYAEGMRESDREKFAMILSASQQMRKLIDDLLKLESSESAKSQKSENVMSRDFAEVFDDVRSMLSWLQREKEIELETAISADLRAEATEEDVSIILQNLYENALRYTPRDGKVSISINKTRALIEIHLRDTGIGISQNDLPKVFERFWRADKARSKAEGGTGLGLAITKSIVDRVGGSISVQSEVGKGTAFTVRLPASKN